MSGIFSEERRRQRDERRDRRSGLRWSQYLMLILVGIGAVHLPETIEDVWTKLVGLF